MVRAPLSNRNPRALSQPGFSTSRHSTSRTAITRSCCSTPPSWKRLVHPASSVRGGPTVLQLLAPRVTDRAPTALLVEPPVTAQALKVLDRGRARDGALAPVVGIRYRQPEKHLVQCSDEPFWISLTTRQLGAEVVPGVRTLQPPSPLRRLAYA